MKIIGNKIKELVDERKLTDAAFARLLGNARSYPKKLYNQTSVSTATLTKISGILNVPLSYWFEDSELEPQLHIAAEPEEAYITSSTLLMQKLTDQNKILIQQNEQLLKSKE